MKKTSPLSLSLLASVVGIACGGSTSAKPVARAGEGRATSHAHLRSLSLTRDAAFQGVAVPASLPVFYVATSGDDGGSCTQDAPCRQIGRAIQLAMTAGGRIEVASGTYDGFAISKYPGTADAPLVVEATGDDVEILPGAARDTIYLDRSDHVTLSGLRSFHAPRAAVRISGSNFARVENGVFGDNARWGIFTDFSDDTTLVGNEIYGSASEHGIYASNSGDRPQIVANEVYGNNQSGIQINADFETQDDYGIYRGVADGLTTGARIEGNYVYGNGSGGAAAINLDGVQDSIVRNNVVYDNHATGIVMYGDADGIPGDGLGGGDGFDGDGHWGPSGMLVEYNTIVMTSDSRTPLMIRYSHGASPNVVRNNIFTQEGTGDGSIQIGGAVDIALLASDYNVLPSVLVGDSDVRPLADWRTSTGQDAHSLAASPSALFVDPSQDDFQLAAGSPAIDRGVAQDDATDVTGAPRKPGAATDLGAFQNQ